MMVELSVVAVAGNLTSDSSSSKTDLTPADFRLEFQKQSTVALHVMNYVCYIPYHVAECVNYCSTWDVMYV